MILADKILLRIENNYMTVIAAESDVRFYLALVHETSDHCCMDFCGITLDGLRRQMRCEPLA